ncbi:MAG: sugar phosphate isomerase/epimerase [Armatimonadetes bacterium]|jgi:sugar phosphate isomerase/epimerase|nr:sugar phosphate isomerase/epimerase [Armatimonadota bacterium]
MHVSIRDATLQAGGFESIRQGLTALGISAVELSVGRDYQVTAVVPTPGRPTLPIETDDDVEELRRHLEDAGVTVPAFLLSNDFGREDLDREIAWVTRVVEAAGALQIPVVRIDALMRLPAAPPDPGQAREAHLERFATAVRRILDATPDAPVDLGIENHGVQGNDPAFLEGLLDRAADPRLGLTLDTGNFYWSGLPLVEVYEVLARFAPQTRHTHVKNIGYPPSERDRRREPGWRYEDFVCPLEEGDIDLLRVRDLLRDAGYDHDLCLEDESLGRFRPEERQAVLRRDVEYLQRLVGS